MADWCLPRRLFAQRPRSRSPIASVIVVTFGGGVRYEDTLAPRGLGEHSASRDGARAAGARLSRGALRRAHRTLQLHRRAGHGLPAGGGRLRQRSAGDADGLRAVPQAVQPAARRGLGDRDQQELRPDGREQAARLRRSVVGERHPAEAAADRDDQVGREHRRGPWRRGSAGAGRADDGGARRGLRGIRLARVRGRPQHRRRAQGEPREVAARLLQRSDRADERRRADVLHDARRS